jgi:hypothetical protein
MINNYGNSLITIRERPRFQHNNFGIGLVYKLISINNLKEPININIFERKKNNDSTK